jgi:hypothetical protein
MLRHRKGAEKFFHLLPGKNQQLLPLSVIAVPHRSCANPRSIKIGKGAGRKLKPDVERVSLFIAAKDMRENPRAFLPWGRIFLQTERGQRIAIQPACG